MSNLEEIVSKTNEKINDEVPIDTDHKKSREYLQGKLNKTSEIIKEKLETRDKSKKENTDDNDDQEIGSVAKFMNGKVDCVSNVTCLAHSLSAYLITANQRNEEKLKDLTVKIYATVNNWLSNLFRLVFKDILVILV